MIIRNQYEDPVITFNDLIYGDIFSLKGIGSVGGFYIKTWPSETATKNKDNALPDREPFNAIDISDGAPSYFAGKEEVRAYKGAELILK